MVYLNLQIQAIAQGLIDAGFSLSSIPPDAAVAFSTTAPTSPNEGQLWLSSTTNALSIWNGTAWQAVGLSAAEKAILDNLATGYYTSSQVDAALNLKQDALQSGTTIKTLNSESIMGSGNIVVTAAMGALNDLTTVTAPTPTNGQALIYNATTSQWENSTLPSGVTDHTLLTNIGTNTHSQIDTALTRLANTSGTNTGDQDLSGYSLTTHNHSGVYADVSHSHSYLPLSGGTLTGAITALRETKVDLGAGTDIDLSLGNVFTKTISGATTLTVSGWLATGNANSFILELTNGGSAVITWVSGAKWAGGTAPTFTVSGVDIVGMYSHDGGTTWRAMLLSKDSK